MATKNGAFLIIMLTFEKQIIKDNFLKLNN